MNLPEAAQHYLAAGLCVLPAKRAEKRPAIGRWKQYRKRLPTEAEVLAWFANPRSSPDALCILCGKVSGNAEMIDFDAGGEKFDAWTQRIPADLLAKLVIERTQHDGRHVYYRCEGEVCGNMKLAQRHAGGAGGKIVTLIETRGEGGLFLCAPTPGYDVIQGDLANPPVLTMAERDILLRAAWELNDCPPPPLGARPVARVGDVSRPGGGGPVVRPGDDYNARGDVRDLLAAHGWALARAGENEYWRRPGKASGTSATLKDGVFYVFSANAAPFEPNQPYAPFAVYTLLEHGGDWEAAAAALRRAGYGERAEVAAEPDDGLNISAIAGQAALPAAKSTADRPLVQNLKTLFDRFEGLHPPIIHGLLREGETMNIIASPKVGKSLLASRLAISVASGLDWLGMKVEPGRVLHIDNELHEPTLVKRYQAIGEAMEFPYHLYSGNIDAVYLRGRLRDLYALAGELAEVEPGAYKLVIIDAFYRTLPRDTDENDNGAIAGLYNLIDYCAERMRCAFVLIHHTSKGNQSGKSVTDVGAGAGSQSRAADTHLVLRPHEEEGVFVMESAVRSWPPLPPRALSLKWPLFVPADEVEPSALLGIAKPKANAKAATVDEFVAQCIGAHDPCSKASVHYEAEQRFGMPERKADQMLDLALERGDAAQIKIGARTKYVVQRAGVAGERALWAAAILAHNPEVDRGELAEMVGLSERHLRRIKAELEGAEP